MPLIDFDSASEWELLLFHQREVVSRRQALRFLSASAIRHRLRTARWQQPHRAVYVTTTGDLTWSQMRWAALSDGGAGAGGRSRRSSPDGPPSSRTACVGCGIGRSRSSCPMGGR